MFRIGQFSIINRITVKTLRYYDEIGLLKPSVIDAYTGYRMYSTEQLPRLQNIIALKQIGLSLSDIAVVLQDDGDTKEIIHRLEDDDDKLVVIPEGKIITDEEIENMVAFQEKWFKHTILRK